MLETLPTAGKLMAANRGEIAIRIFRAATELGLTTVSIFAEEDRFSIHRFKADEAYQLDASKGPVGAYLDVEGIVTLAKQKGVTMIHPGYGFLSENAAFARACEREGITFVGPSPDLLENMGDKTAARALAHKFKVPTLRNIELTGPYFHDGKLASLDQTVRTMAHLQLDKKLTDDETHDLVAFLGALTDKERATVRR